MNEVLRQERKFLISATQRARFEGQLDALLHQMRITAILCRAAIRCARCISIR